MNLWLLTVASWPFIATGLLVSGMALLLRSSFAAKIAVVVSVIGVVLAIGGVVQIWAHGPKAHLG